MQDVAFNLAKEAPAEAFWAKDAAVHVDERSTGSVYLLRRRDKVRNRQPNDWVAISDILPRIRKVTFVEVPTIEA